MRVIFAFVPLPIALASAGLLFVPAAGYTGRVFALIGLILSFVISVFATIFLDGRLRFVSAAAMVVSLAGLVYSIYLTSQFMTGYWL